MSTVRERLRRGHLLPRAWQRLVRDVESIVTTVILSTTQPLTGRAAVLTLNPDEENATVQAVLLGQDRLITEIVFLSPSPETAQLAVKMAAKRLDLPLPAGLRFQHLRYSTMLRAFRSSSQTYSTHVLLPGRDLSNRRRHVHLTHGSGPKPDTTFRAPTNVLASITPQWVTQQLEEYQLPASTEIIEYMPRLEIMRRSADDPSILHALGLSSDTKLVVWAPTYRLLRRGNEIRSSGLALSRLHGLIPQEINDAVEDISGHLVVKPHPHEADDYSDLGLTVLTNDDLRSRGVTAYELFGAAALVITDYSSIYLERERLGLAYLLVQPDKEAFRKSYRGFRRGV